MHACLGGRAARQDGVAAHKGLRASLVLWRLLAKGLHKLRIELGCLRLLFLWRSRQRTGEKISKLGAGHPAPSTAGSLSAALHTFFRSSSCSLCFCRQHGAFRQGDAIHQCQGRRPAEHADLERSLLALSRE